MIKYVSQADGVLIVYDISVIFSDLGGWIPFALKHRSKNSKTILVGNKLDIKVYKGAKKIKNKAENNGIRYVEVSA